MSRLNIIALMGKLQSGKDTAGQMLIDLGGGVRVAFADKLKAICGEMYGLTHEQMNTEEGKAEKTTLTCLRCPLCSGIACQEVKLDREWKAECLNPSCKAVGEIKSFRDFWTPRMILQHVGTEGMRRVDPNVWVRYALDHAKTILTEGVEVTVATPGHRRKVGDRFTPNFVVLTDCRFRSEMAGVVAAGGEVWRIKRPNNDASSTGIANHASEMEMDSIPDGEFNRVINNDGTLGDLKARVSAALTQFMDR